MSEESDDESEHEMGLDLFFAATISPPDDDSNEGFMFDRLFSHGAERIVEIKHNRARSGLDGSIPVTLIESRNFNDPYLKRYALKRLGYILRQNTTMDQLEVLGSDGIGYHGRRPDYQPTPGLWFCVGLQCNSSLIQLSLSRIDIQSHNALHALAPFIANNPVLETLELMNCNLGPKDIWQLSCSLIQRSSSSLKEVNLDRNHVGDNCMQMLVMGLWHNRCTRRVSLAGTKASGKAIRSLSWLLEKESMLEELDLRDNSMDTSDALGLIKSLERNDTFKTLTLKGNPLHWEIISHRLLKLLCNSSSISGAVASNHTLCSILEPRNGVGWEWYDDEMGWQIPMKDLCHQSLDEDDAYLLFASLELNHKMGNDSLKVRHKALWRLVRGDLHASDASIDISLMPRVLALLGRGYTSAVHCEACEKASAKLVQYQEESRLPLDTIRLGSVYRAVRARPELCSEKSTELRASLKLAHCEADNERLRLELKAMADEMELLRSQIRVLGRNEHCRAWLMRQGFEECARL